MKEYTPATLSYSPITLAARTLVRACVVGINLGAGHRVSLYLVTFLYRSVSDKGPLSTWNLASF